MSEPQGRRPRAVWGAKGIAEYVNTTERRAYDLLERGIIPARKIGNGWQSTDLELDDFLLGRPAAPDREAV